MDEDLFSMWSDINADYFGGELNTPTSIAWDELSGSEGIGAFAAYFPISRCIVIDARFRFDGVLAAASDPDETAKLEIAYRLMLHEMIHQALYQRGVSRPGQHGESFVNEATRLAEMLGVAPPDEGTAAAWPDLAWLLAGNDV